MVMEWREELAKRLTPGGGQHRIDLPRGWRKVIMDMVAKIDALKIPWQIEFAYKKFGVLYFAPHVDIDHKDGRWDTMTKLIHDADKQASETCEDCGEAGSVSSLKYIVSILCEFCRETRRRDILNGKGGTSV
jgi:hypothetical protein